MIKRSLVVGGALVAIGFFWLHLLMQPRWEARARFECAREVHRVVDALAARFEHEGIHSASLREVGYGGACCPITGQPFIYHRPPEGAAANEFVVVEDSCPHPRGERTVAYLDGYVTFETSR